MAETEGNGYLHQVHSNTAQERREAALVMADTAIRRARGSGSRYVRRKRDLVTVLLLLDLIDEEQVPAWFEEAYSKRMAYFDLGRQTQFKPKE